MDFKIYTPTSEYNMPRNLHLSLAQDLSLSSKGGFVLQDPPPFLFGYE